MTVLAAIDVQYDDPHAAAACVAFNDWTDGTADRHASIRIDGVAPYVPGRFYERELPCILAVIEEIKQSFELIIIDGYVWLAHERPGLGQYLFEALGGGTPVVGVAKSEFADNDAAVPILRGSSGNPLFVTAAGCDLQTAASNVLRMHGANRIPTLLKSVDTLCRRAIG